MNFLVDVRKNETRDDGTASFARKPSDAVFSYLRLGMVAWYTSA